MSTVLADDTNQPKAGAFATIPTDKEIAADLKAANSGTEGTPGDDAEHANDGASTEDELPEKFKGKSALEIAASYGNLEEELGRQAQEVGSLRKLTDQLLELRPTDGVRQQAASQTDLPELTADDVLNDPRSAIQSVVSEEAGAVNTRVDNLEAQLGLDAFERRHPDFRKDQKDPVFMRFVQDSPYRQGLAQKTLAGDLGAAEELWDAWGEEQPGEEETEQNLSAKEQEALDSAEALAARGGESAQPGDIKPISRHDLAKVKIEDETRYYSDAFQSYIQKMYRLKLVK